MKKKAILLACLVLAIGLVVLTSCSNKKEETEVANVAQTTQ